MRNIKSFAIAIVYVLLLLIEANGQTTNKGATGVHPEFKPTWESLSQYKVPEWFRDAKFGIWAHWGPQCQPEQGDWYGRFIFWEGSDTKKWHFANY